MMNWTYKLILLVGLLAAFLVGCDSFQEDAQPKGEEELDIKNSVSALPGTQLLLDLKQRIKTENAVKFGIDISPSRGSAEISSDAILTYSPNQDFLSGYDLLSLNLFDAAGNLIDTDSIQINMAQSADSLPCFNGALSDYYTVYKNQSIVFEPILNDGYCVEQTSGAVINFISEPENGTIEKTELFTYSYTPDPDFVGTDEFMYELELIDEEGNSDFSLAKVQMTVYENDSTIGDCDLSLEPFNYAFPEPRNDVYILEAVQNCSDFVGISIVSVADGWAAYDSLNEIRYHSGTAMQDQIIYDVEFTGGTFRNEIKISFFDSDSTGNCQAVFEAQDDHYDLDIVQDSIGTMFNPYRLPVTNNDVSCDGVSHIELVEGTEPRVGELDIDGDVFIYFVSEEFAGPITTDFQYMFWSNGGLVDTARVELKIQHIAN